MNEQNIFFYSLFSCASFSKPQNVHQFFGIKKREKKGIRKRKLLLLQNLQECKYFDNVSLCLHGVMSKRTLGDSYFIIFLCVIFCCESSNGLQEVKNMSLYNNKSLMRTHKLFSLPPLTTNQQQYQQEREKKKYFSR